VTERPIESSDVMIGSYSLESLTTGMYEDPFHCVREYVQNAFDAIRAARADDVLAEGSGSVAISITGTAKRPSLSVEDDGIGLPAADAVRTLVSVGASTKRSTVNAGFRGIGRLAGIAYCGTMRFTTSVRGEVVATVVEFDCGRMRSFMRPSAEWQDVRAVIQACATTYEVPSTAEAHGTKAEMIGLTGVGVEFAEIGKLVPYLRQVCPIDYSDRFSFAGQIRTFAEGVGHPIPTVEVETRYKRERTQILKAYDDVTPTSNPRFPSTLAGVDAISSEGWFGWIGRSNFKGELTDNTVAGIRFRVKNIQIDGSDLIESLAAELTIGGTEGRLQRYAVGEVFITNAAVIPNARRDGFEDSAAWRAIRAEIKERVAKRIITLVREASISRTRIKALSNEIDALRRKLAADSIAPADADRVSRSLDGLLAKLRPDKLTGGNPEEVGDLISVVKTLKEKLQSLKSRSPAINGGRGSRIEFDGAKEERGTSNNEKGAGGELESASDAIQVGGEPSEPVEGAHETPRWTADEVLKALRVVMLRELGADQCDALFASAYDALKAG
jgi:hypothetical protein